VALFYYATLRMHELSARSRCTDIIYLTVSVSRVKSNEIWSSEIGRVCCC